MALVSFNSSDMECTSGSAFESGWVMEDAGSLDDSSLLPAILFSHQPLVVTTLVVVLPMARLKTLHRLLDRLEILVIKKVCTK